MNPGPVRGSARWFIAIFLVWNAGAVGDSDRWEEGCTAWYKTFSDVSALVRALSAGQVGDISALNRALHRKNAPLAAAADFAVQLESFPVSVENPISEDYRKFLRDFIESGRPRSRVAHLRPALALVYLGDPSPTAFFFAFDIFESPALDEFYLRTGPDGLMARMKKLIEGSCEMYLLDELGRQYEQLREKPNPAKQEFLVRLVGNLLTSDSVTVAKAAADLMLGFGDTHPRVGASLEHYLRKGRVALGSRAFSKITTELARWRAAR